MDSSIFMHQLEVGGVHATYYDAPDFTAPRSARQASQAIGNAFFLVFVYVARVRVYVRARARARSHAHARAHTLVTGGYPVAQIGWQSMSATAGLPGGSIATADGYSVRWAGFVSPTQDGVYTFQWARSGNVAGDRVKLWVDNR